MELGLEKLKSSPLSGEAQLSKENVYNFKTMSLLLYTIHIVLNFLETPLISTFYIFELFFFFYLAFTKKWSDLLIPSLVFVMIEGQGRVLLGYNLILKNIFDIYIITIIARDAIRTKRLFDFAAIPPLFRFLIVMHFIVYFIQFFNYQSLGPLAVLLASKIYILPFIMFFLFLKNPIRLEYSRILTISFVYIILLQVILIFNQMKLGEAHLLAISPHYFKILKETFVGFLFRPFGTSFIFGGPSVVFPYFAGLFFLVPAKRRTNFLKLILLILMFFALIMMQVRTSLLQFIIVLIGIAFATTLSSKKKLLIIPIIAFFFMAIPTLIFNNIKNLDRLFPDYNLSNSLTRIESLSKIETIGRSRATPTLFYNTLVDKLDKTPFGLGPGRTGAANSPFVNKIKNDLLFNMDYSWTLDNLFISLAIDFGYGMIFYSLIIILLPLLLILKSFQFFREKKFSNPKLTIPAIITFVILLSNWGALAIPYNPVSFFFWLFSAIGLNELRKQKKDEDNV